MDPRALFRPLPLAVAALFVITAAVDLARVARRPPPPLPQLLADAEVTFEEAEPAFDFRIDEDGRPRPIGGAVRLGSGGWEREARGLWIRRDGAEMEIDLTRSDSRALALELMPSRGASPVYRLGVEVNESDVGALDLDKGWSTRVLGLPPGSTAEGRNSLRLRLLDRPPDAQPRRAVLLRRMALLQGTEAPRWADLGREALHFRAERAAVAIRRSGTLRVRFEMDRRIDALVVGYRFTGPPSRAGVAVSKVEATGTGPPAELRRELSAAGRKKGRVRFPLHGQRGTLELSIEAELASGSSMLELTVLRLVDEDDQSSG
jgi:hypothetical protein